MSRPDLITYREMTRQDWRNRLLHSHSHPSRKGGYRLIEAYLTAQAEAQRFIEVGFGTCFDFRQRFQSWHDEGLIDYTGYDCDEGQAGHAIAEYPDYDFRHGTFLDMEECDISFTRYTFMHVAPHLMQPHLRAMLRATRGLAVVEWRLTPSNAHAHFNPPAHETPLGAWANAYDVGVVDGIVKEHGFDIEKHEFGQGEMRGKSDTIYVMRKQ